MFFRKLFHTTYFLLIILFIFSCKKEEIVTDPSAKLSFSADSILFDTVFTTIGSVTKQLKVYNPNNQKILISSITLAGGQVSNFTINIDGIPTNSATNIELNAKDSIYIFIEVTVDPNSQNTPFVVNDSIVFITNGNVQDIDLIAWGQNAYYHTPNTLKLFPLVTGDSAWIPISYAGCASPWKTDKPHLLYGIVFIDEDSTLTIPAGAKIYLHKDAILWVYKEGTLQISGEIQSPVYFQGDRLEQAYKDLPGQWDRIWLSAGSKNNVINYAIIRNGNVGVQVDTLGDSFQPTLIITNTIIENMAGAGIFGQGSYIVGNNCVITNCGIYNVALTIGGKYNFIHCTFANFWDYSYRDTPLLILNNYYEDINGNIQKRDLTEASFYNCILYGDITEEIELDLNQQAISNYLFAHCILKTSRNVSDATHYIEIITNPDINSIFNNYFENDYSLSELSVAVDKGDMTYAIVVPYDIKGNLRISDEAPDLGAYEWIE